MCEASSKFLGHLPVNAKSVKDVFYGRFSSTAMLEFMTHAT